MSDALDTVLCEIADHYTGWRDRAARAALERHVASETAALRRRVATLERRLARVCAYGQLRNCGGSVWSRRRSGRTP